MIEDLMRQTRRKCASRRFGSSAGCWQVSVLNEDQCLFHCLFTGNLNFWDFEGRLWTTFAFDRKRSRRSTARKRVPCWSRNSQPTCKGVRLNSSPWRCFPQGYCQHRRLLEVERAVDPMEFACLRPIHFLTAKLYIIPNIMSRRRAHTSTSQLTVTLLIAGSKYCCDCPEGPCLSM